MKIIYFFRSLAVVGGVEKVLTDKMNYLSQLENYEITLITYEQGNNPIVFPLSSKVKHIDLNILFYKCYQFNIIKRSFIQIDLKKRLKKTVEQLVDTINPDIIITTTYSMLEIDILSKLKDTSKKIIETHSARDAIGKTILHKNNLIMRLAAYFADQRFYKQISHCHELVTLTTKDASAWKDVKEAVIIPNMLSYFPTELPKKGIMNKHVISVGRLTAQKGYDLLIEAWEYVYKKYPDWKLDIYGDGEDREMLQHRINNSKLATSIFIHASTNHIYQEYAKSSFYIMASRWEGFGLVLAEAMSCGIPCISFDCPYGPSDIITDGVDGLLVENGNVNQLADKIIYFIEHENIRMEMGGKARENVKRFLPEKIMPQWENLFNRLTAKQN